jgi:hypothetical protein
VRNRERPFDQTYAWIFTHARHQTTRAEPVLLFRFLIRIDSHSMKRIGIKMNAASARASTRDRIERYKVAAAIALSV